MTTGNQSLLRSAHVLAEKLQPGDLDATLQNVTAAAVELIPEVTYASVTVRHGDGHIDTVAPTGTALQALDELQYTLREGPCYDAATDSLYLIAPTLRDDPRFPKYGPAAAEAGIRAQAAFRLFERGQTQGALNLYAAQPGAFGELDDVAALFRSHAAVAIAYAYEVGGLEEALATRKVIGQAMGAVMERYQLTDERAFAFLTRLSQYRNVKLRRVAQELVAEVERNAKAPRENGAPSGPATAAPSETKPTPEAGASGQPV